MSLTEILDLGRSSVQSDRLTHRWHNSPQVALPLPHFLHIQLLVATVKRTQCINTGEQAASKCTSFFQTGSATEPAASCSLVQKPGLMHRDQQYQCKICLSLIPTWQRTWVEKTERNQGLQIRCRNSLQTAHQAGTKTPAIQHQTFHLAWSTKETCSGNFQGCPSLQEERAPSICNSLLVYSCPFCYSNWTHNMLVLSRKGTLSFLLVPPFTACQSPH